MNELMVLLMTLLCTLTKASMVALNVDRGTFPQHHAHHEEALEIVHYSEDEDEDSDDEDYVEPPKKFIPERDQ